jgi:hypothetical protein
MFGLFGSGIFDVMTALPNPNTTEKPNQYRMGFERYSVGYNPNGIKTIDIKPRKKIAA